MLLKQPKRHQGSVGTTPTVALTTPVPRIVDASSAQGDAGTAWWDFTKLAIFQPEAARRERQEQEAEHLASRVTAGSEGQSPRWSPAPPRALPACKSDHSAVLAALGSLRTPASASRTVLGGGRTLDPETRAE